MIKWDKGVEYTYIYSRIVNHMARASGKAPAICYDAILLIQLANGARISEATEAFIHFLRSGGEETYVRLAKKRRPVERLVIFPLDVRQRRDELVKLCSYLAEVPKKNLLERVKFYAKYRYQVNTHSLRYAFVTYLLRQGVNPAIIAKITGHARLDHILTYTQVRAAEALLRELMK